MEWIPIKYKMKKYHKINTIFMRDESTKHKSLMLDQFSKPEFEYLKDIPWLWTEKIDGTNIRIQYSVIPIMSVKHTDYDIKGKTDEAQIYAKLNTELRKIFPLEKMIEVFGDDYTDVCLYGEGVGKGVQRDAERYTPVPGFILFDVWISGFWLERKNVEDIAKKFGIDVAPIVMEGTFLDAIKMCQDGFKSVYGDFIAEGLVGIPKVQLFNRDGERVVTKLKYKDFNIWRQEKSTKVDKSDDKQVAERKYESEFKAMEGGTDGG